MTPDRPTICNQGKTGENPRKASRTSSRKASRKPASKENPRKASRKPAQGIKHPRPPPLSCHAAHAGAGTRARTSWSINLRTHTAAAPGQTAWYGQTGRQEKNRSSKTRRGAATKTSEISAILTQATRACLPQLHDLVALRRLR